MYSAGDVSHHSDHLNDDTTSYNDLEEHTPNDHGMYDTHTNAYRCTRT